MADTQVVENEEEKARNLTNRSNSKANKPIPIICPLEKENDGMIRVESQIPIIEHTDEPSVKPRKKRSTIKRLFSRRVRKGSDSDSVHSFGDYLMSPTHPRHLGIFQFMPFEYDANQYEKDRCSLNTHESDTPLSTKEKLRHILHSQALHLIIIVLVLFDSVLVVIELLFDLRIIGPENGEHIAREISHGFSIGILSMFMVELVLKLWADHLHFIRHKIEVLDALVVTVSWVIDIVLVFVDSIGLLATELLLLLRLWRVFRIVNGIIVAVKTKADEKVHFLKDKVIELHQQLAEAEENVDSLKRDVEALKAKLKEHGIKMTDHRI